jgi:phytoene dehydrogenase-like protein
LKSGVQIVTRANVESIHSGKTESAIRFSEGGQSYEVDARYVLCNAPREVLNRLQGRDQWEENNRENEGSVFKINLLLKRLPELRSNRVSAEDAFTGTFHIDEGYEQMTENYRQSREGILPDRPACEIYCHSLTDDSILSADLSARGFQTLTCFGLDAPYGLFRNVNETSRTRLLKNVIRGVNRYLAEPIEDCFAVDADGTPCFEIKTPVDLEKEIHLPRGNIFHNSLGWPFAEEDSEAGQWGVETGTDRTFLCGSSAKRGGCVSGIPGHNAARKVLECEGFG